MNNNETFDYRIYAYPEKGYLTINFNNEHDIQEVNTNEGKLFTTRDKFNREYTIIFDKDARIMLIKIPLDAYYYKNDLENNTMPETRGVFDESHNLYFELSWTDDVSEKDGEEATCLYPGIYVQFKDKVIAKILLQKCNELLKLY